MKDWNLILIALLLISWMIIQNLYCNRGKGHSQTITDTIQVYDTNTYVRIKDSLQIRVSIKQRVETKTITDTIQVLQEFFTKNVYIDSLVDSNIRIVTTDTVIKNQIKSRKYQYNILRPQTIITNTTINKYNRFSFGVQAGYGITKLGLSPYIGFGGSYRVF